MQYPTIFCEITCSLKFRIWETMQAIVTKMQLENAGLLQFSGNVGHFNPVANHQPIFRSCKQSKKNKRIEKRSNFSDLVELEHRQKKVPSSLCGSNSSTFILI